jgi:hypothetical protein
LQESPGSDRETIETYSLPFIQTSVSKHEITYLAYTKQMHDRKKTFMGISTIHRE